MVAKWKSEDGVLKAQDLVNPGANKDATYWEFKYLFEKAVKSEKEEELKTHACSILTVIDVLERMTRIAEVELKNSRPDIIKESKETVMMARTVCYLKIK